MSALNILTDDVKPGSFFSFLEKAFDIGFRSMFNKEMGLQFWRNPSSLSFISINLLLFSKFLYFSYFQYLLFACYYFSLLPSIPCICICLVFVVFVLNCICYYRKKELHYWFYIILSYPMPAFSHLLGNSKNDFNCKHLKETQLWLLEGYNFAISNSIF